MKIDGVTYTVDWKKFRIGSSFFVPCVGIGTGKKAIQKKMQRLGFVVIIKVVIEDDIRGLRIWRKTKYTTAAT